MPQSGSGLARVERAREVHDDAGVPAVGVLPGQPDDGRDDAAQRGDDRRHPPRSSQRGTRTTRASATSTATPTTTTGQRKGVMTGRGATSATTATASSPTPVSRSSGGRPLSPCADGIPAPSAHGPAAQASRTERLTAETTALMEAVTIEGSTPTPHRTRSPTAHST